MALARGSYPLLSFTTPQHTDAYATQTSCAAVSVENQQRPE